MPRRRKRKRNNTVWISSRTWIGLILSAIFVGCMVAAYELSLVEEALPGFQTSVVPQQGPDPNQPPPLRAIITPTNYSIYTGENLVLDAGMSTGDTLRYRWQYAEGIPAKDTTVNLPNNFITSATAAVTFGTEGTHKFLLTVQDKDQREAQAVAYIQVSRTPNRLPIPKLSISSQSALSEMVVNQPVQLSAADSIDPDGQIITYTFGFAQKPEGSVAQLAQPGENITRATFLPDKRGVYEVELTVTDNEGAKGTIRQSVMIYGPGDCLISMTGTNDTCDISDIAEIIQAYGKSYKL